MNIQSTFVDTTLGKLCKSLAGVTFYSGTIPANTEEAPTGDLLVSLAADIATNQSINTFAVASGVASWNYLKTTGDTHASSAISATGVATFARVEVKDTYARSLFFDFSVGLTGSGADIELASTDFIIGDYVRIDSGQIQISLSAG